MDYVAARCLRGAAFDVGAAHRLMNCLLDDLGLRGLFEPGLPLLKRRCLELRLLVDARCPSLAQRLGEHGVVLEMFAASWLQTLFVYVDAFPPAALDRCWTLFLFERNWKIVHRLALATLAALEPHVLATCDRPDQSLTLLATLTKGDPRDDAPTNALVFGDGDDGAVARRFLARAMDIKVTQTMLSRIANNASLPPPLRAKGSTRHDTFGVLQP